MARDEPRNLVINVMASKPDTREQAGRSLNATFQTQRDGARQGDGDVRAWNRRTIRAWSRRPADGDWITPVLRAGDSSLFLVVAAVLLIAGANLANLLLRGIDRSACVSERLDSVEGRIVRGEGSDRTGRCVLGFEADGYPGEPCAPDPATTVLIMLDIDSGLDMRVLAFTLTISLATGILFGFRERASAREQVVLQHIGRANADAGPGHRRRRPPLTVERWQPSR
jgi:hypothetical protein